jgi:hypothetical protein
MTRPSIAVALASTLALAACGGGETTPSSSSTSSGAGGSSSSASSTSSSSSSSSGSGGSGGALGLVARLSVSGKDILDPDGKTIVLRGWNWGQWGTEQPEDAADNKQQGANIVRVPLRWWGDYPDMDDARKDSDPGHIDKGHLDILDKEIDDITAQGLWVDLFVDSNCGQASTVHDTAAACGLGTDGLPANFANDPDAKQKFLELWSFLAAHYGTHPYIAMYEVLSEPNMGCMAHAGCADWSAIPKFYESVIPAIRAQDPLTPVLVGPGASYELKKIDTARLTGVSNVIYTGDILSAASGDAATVAIATSFRDTNNVPIFIQQVGVKKSDMNAQGRVNQTLPALNAAGIGWTWWTYREPNNPNNNGFAPYCKSQNSGWMLDAPWLALVDGYFNP